MNPYDADIGGPVEEVVSAEKSQPALVSGAKNKVETDPLLVALNKITDETPLAEAAKIYQSLGFKIFPLQTKRKEPLPGSQGHKEATNDLDQILKWWGEDPSYNIGLLCDEASFTLIDVDKPSDLSYPGKGSHKKDGEKSLKENGIILPETLTAETWSGGEHKFFLYAPDAGKNVGNIKVGPQNVKLEGIDRRNEGKGFAVVAPSVIRADDGTEHRYRWTELVPPAPYPEALKTTVSSSPAQSADLFSSTTPKRGLTREEALQRMERMRASRPKPPAKTYDEDEKRRRASAYLATLPPSNDGSGEGSNNLLHAASVLVVGFQLDDATALEMLWSEYNPRCSPVWERNATNEAVYVRKLNEARRTSTKPLGYLLNAERPQASFASTEEAKPGSTRKTEEPPPETETRQFKDEAKQVVSLPPFTNVTMIATMKNGKVVNQPMPKKLNALSAEIFHDYSSWPCNIGGCLFDFHEEKKPKDRIEKLPSSADLFAWIARKGDRNVDWHKSGGCHTKEELFAQLKSEARRYEMISFAPHYPKREDVFYSVPKLPPPDPEHKSFEKFIDFFNPCDAAHRTVMKAFFLTPLWFDAGRDGEFVKPPPRPGFIIDTLDAQASGKSTVVNMCAQLYGSSCIRKSKTTLADESSVKKSILSEEGRRKRIFLLDNVTGTLKSDFLADLMTSPEITGLAPYGHGDESRPNDLTFAVTVNGASVDTDLATRFYTVKIHAPDPALLEQSATSEMSIWECRIDKFIAEHRLQLFADMIDAIERAPYRSRKGSRFPVFDARVLSAASCSDEEFVAASLAISEDASSANVDKANGETFTALVEATLTGMIGGPLFEPERLTMLTNAAVMAIIEKEPSFAKWSVNTLRERLLKPGLLPDFARSFERFQNSDPGHERGFFYGLHLQGVETMIRYQVLDYFAGQYKVTRIGMRSRFDK